MGIEVMDELIHGDETVPIHQTRRTLPGRVSRYIVRVSFLGVTAASAAQYRHHQFDTYPQPTRTSFHPTAPPPFPVPIVIVIIIVIIVIIIIIIITVIVVVITSCNGPFHREFDTESDGGFE
jgi:hypothetical protein